MSLEYETFFKNKCQASADVYIDPISYSLMSVEGAYFCSKVNQVKMMMI